MRNELINFWRRCPLTKPPFVHPDDLPILRSKYRKFCDEETANFQKFIGGSRFGDFDDHRLHLSLLPAPYVGDLGKAKIVILLLNPGFSYTDYWAESNSQAFSQRRKNTLCQLFNGDQFPFFELDPYLCWHAGFVWWEKKLRDVITKIAERKFNRCYFKALRDLSRKLACLELIPYHSPSFRAHALVKKLPSVERVREFVRDTLIPDAKARRRTVIVTRQAKAWGIEPPYTGNLIVYKGGEARGASLSRKSPGGKAILRHYGLER